MKFKKVKDFGIIFKKAAASWWQRDPFRQGAVIAYYTIFALPGLLVVAISIAGYFFGNEVVSGELHQQISNTIDTNTADSVQRLLERSMETEDSSWATILGFATILIGATTVFAQFQKSLNEIWEVEPEAQKAGIWPLIKTRLFSFGLIITIGFLLLISLILSSFLSAFGSWIRENWSDHLLTVIELAHFAFSLGIITLLFALMMKALPDAKIRWRTVWIGAFMTALLFVVGEFALGLYFGNTDPGSGYGPAGSVILLLLWTSYSSMIVFLGAEFTKAYSDHHYGKSVPDEHAKEKSK
ncbi:YihY/virulence factor BrkB family protein [Marivirga sp. S37H4]|uniref:YihY/virulence factor BrkB family protein n=1 Tax=Marivirga aurantiaca TaxID=2802615 RepID=A0A934WWC2_9BACT|nr:YihY/virulence factor BrkB family protein [Marivirga aurantiaca]MBK6264091.1 YihY/virulence factor BrkB family protein [Marivirga aurantiaca]